MTSALAIDRMSKHEILRKVSEEMEKIAEDHPEGLLTAESVVGAAADPASPLHLFFEWDDSAAAAEYRLFQARSLIRKVRVTNPADLNAEPIPKFVSLMDDRQREGGGYRETAQVLANDELIAQLEATAKKELESWVHRHAMLTGLCKAVAEAAGIDMHKKTKRKEQSKAG
jgi:hypothetical protein